MALTTEEVRPQLQGLKQSGFVKLAEALDERMGEGNNVISIQDIVHIFQQHSRYSYKPERSYILPRFQGSPYEEYSRFLDDKGGMKAQCNGGNGFLSAFLHVCFQAAPGRGAISVKKVLGFQGDGNRLERLGHAVTGIYVDGKLVDIVDATPPLSSIFRVNKWFKAMWRRVRGANADSKEKEHAKKPEAAALPNEPTPEKKPMEQLETEKPEISHPRNGGDLLALAGELREAKWAMLRTFENYFREKK